MQVPVGSRVATADKTRHLLRGRALLSLYDQLSTRGADVPSSALAHRHSHAAKHVLGQDAAFIWHKETSLAGADAVILPGGFSHGDYLRVGAVARFSPVMQAVRAFADAGGPVLGICNGFQVLLEAGMLPGAMLRNTGLKFRCEHVHVRVEQTDTPFTALCAVGQVLRMRISCPPTISPCFYGVDTPQRSELIAATHTLPEIRKYLDAESLSYLSLEGMLSAVGDGRASYCTSCYTGNYPVAFPRNEQAYLQLTLKPHVPDLHEVQGVHEVPEVQRVQQVPGFQGAEVQQAQSVQSSSDDSEHEVVGPSGGQRSR